MSWGVTTNGTKEQVLETIEREKTHNASGFLQHHYDCLVAAVKRIPDGRKIGVSSYGSHYTDNTNESCNINVSSSAVIP
jgi:hypothetical protein